MRSEEVSRCIDYIRFTSDLEGADLTQEDVSLLENVLDSGFNVNALINEYIISNSLDLNYTPLDDDQALYENTKCLVNFYNIKDKPLLKRTERFFVNLRTAELFASNIDSQLTFEFLQSIHTHLFGDLYPSAGELRNVDASKRKEFCRPEYIESVAEELFTKLRNDNYLLSIEDRDDFINELAYYMGELEALHPFREGNGRVIRFFIYELIKRAGYDVDWKSADPDRMLEGAIASIDGDCQPLIDVFEEVLI